MQHGCGRAYYRPQTDIIQMPERSLFVGTKTSSPTESYYSTLLHELGHNAAVRIMPRRATLSGVRVRGSRVTAVQLRQLLKAVCRAGAR